MPSGFIVSCMLIINMMLFAKIYNFLKRKIIYTMTISVVHWILEMTTLDSPMQVEDIITNGKRHVFTLQYAEGRYS